MVDDPDASTQPAGPVPAPVPDPDPPTGAVGWERRLELGRLRLDLIRLLPERERAAAALHALRALDDDPPPPSHGDARAWDWTPECALAEAHPDGLAGVWDTTLAPALGIPPLLRPGAPAGTGTGGSTGGAAAPRRAAQSGRGSVWRPSGAGQVERCFHKLQALRVLLLGRDATSPLHPSTRLVLQHLRSLHEPADTARVVRDLTAALRATPLGPGPASPRVGPSTRGAGKRARPAAAGDLVRAGSEPAPAAVAVRLGPRQTHLVLPDCPDMEAFLERLGHVDVPGHRSAFGCLRLALPDHYRAALSVVFTHYEAIVEHLAPTRPARQCLVEAPGVASHTLHFWPTGTASVVRALRHAVLEYAYDADDSLPVWTWFLYRPPHEGATTTPLAPLRLEAFGYACGDVHDWATCLHPDPPPPGAADAWEALRRGLWADEWVEVVRRGAFGCWWSLLTGPVVCRLSHVGGMDEGPPLLPVGQWNVPDDPNELVALLQAVHERLPFLGFRAVTAPYYPPPADRAVARAWAALRADPSPEECLWLALHVPACPPAYRFRYVVGRVGSPRVGLAPGARKTCEDYLAGLAWIRHRYGAGAGAVEADDAASAV